MGFVLRGKGLSNVGKLGLFVLVVLLTILVASQHKQNRTADSSDQSAYLSEPAIKFVTLVIADDLKNGSLGNESAMQAASGPVFLEWTNIDRRATAKEYEAAYDENEIAADNEYKDKKILVTGTLAGIEKDFTGNGFLNLAGSSSFLPGVHAQLTPESMGEAANMKKGQHLNLVCMGAGRVVTIALLNECQPLAHYASDLSPSVESKIHDAISGKVALSDASAHIVAFLYAEGLLLPTDSPCLKGDVRACGDELASLSKDKIRLQAVQDKAKQVLSMIKITH